MKKEVNWPIAVEPLIKKYKGSKHPLEYKDIYQLLVMVVLSAQSSDDLINTIAPEFFKAYPNLQSLAKANPKDFHQYLSKVRNFANKSLWLAKIAGELKKNSNIPLSMDKLVELPGIGRKSANVILREAGASPEGIMVDIHVVRVAPRLGIVSTEDPKKIEATLMELLPSKKWDVGMAMSFHGREVCRPKPLCEICMMRPVCKYYQEVVRPITIGVKG